MSGGNLLDRFLSEIQHTYPIFLKSIKETERANPEQFSRLGSRLLTWAQRDLGDKTMKSLMDGYVAFVMDVNRHQRQYEKTGRYENSSYADVYEVVYDNPAFMANYHWGVYVTTFVWPHHLKIANIFETEFAGLIAAEPGAKIIDLGCGSGVWSLLALTHATDAQSQLVDISQTTASNTEKFLRSNGFDSRAAVTRGDALTFRSDTKFDFGISCFLLEHLERPEALLENLHRLLKDRAYAFVTTALTAAETDHIYEFRRESEVVKLCEDAGFRVVSAHSLAPNSGSASTKFLPRSMSLMLQKRHNDIY